YCSGKEPNNGCGSKCPAGTKPTFCPLPSTYCNGSEPDNGCGAKCQQGTKNNCPNPNTYCLGNEPDNGCGAKCSTGTKDCTPSTLQNLKVLTHTPSSLTWQWDRSAGAISYIVILYDNDLNLIDSRNIGDQLTWQANNLKANTRYLFYVRALNSFGFKQAFIWSADSIENPTGISCVKISTDEITVRVNGILNNLEIANSGIRFKEIVTNTIKNYNSVKQWILGGLTPNTNYTFTVQARNQDALNDGTPDYTVENWQTTCRTFFTPSAINLKYIAGDYCVAPLRPIFSWKFVDSDIGHTQSNYQVQISTNAGFTEIISDSGKILSNSQSYTPITPLPDYNQTYYWRVRVWDQFDVVSNYASGLSFDTPQHRYPEPLFDLSPQVPARNEETQFCTNNQGDCADKAKFKSIAKCYDNSNVLISCAKSKIEWVFQEQDPITNLWQAASLTYLKSTNATSTNPVLKFLNIGPKKVILKITDNLGSCSLEQLIKVIPLPKWKEISP
ncbi:MAG: fibronectin type III domain-containing protein, partial [Candidatus Gribaldobacteria bacterium]|nr:fibronectin type III domain-containing protein [Candidatus Gribaldobacteria bacterium]